MTEREIVFAEETPEEDSSEAQEAQIVLEEALTDVIPPCHRA